MPSCVLLLPGALLPAPLAPDVLRQASAPVLERLMRGAQAPQNQTLANSEALAGAAHLVWLWRVFSRQDGTPVTAPYAWAALGGHELATEIWRARPCHFALARDHMLLESLADDAPSSAEIEARSAALRSAVHEAGFLLQQLNEAWFLTRKDNWPLRVRLWEAQLGATVGPDSVAGEAALAWRKLLNEVQMQWHTAGLNEERESQDRRPINGVWVDGGGHYRRLPPSNFRAVLADDEATRGWALAAGLPSPQVRALQDSWPEAPEGDLLAVLPDLLEAHRNEDWGAWLAALPGLDRRLGRLVAGARARGTRRIVLVATGREASRTLIQAEPGWRLWQRWQSQSLVDWLGEQPDTSTTASGLTE